MISLVVLAVAGALMGAAGGPAARGSSAEKLGKPAAVRSVGPPASAGTVRRGAGSSVKRKVRAIRHLCVLGCLYMRRSCGRMRRGGCAGLFKRCIKPCTDPGRLLAAAMARPAKGWGLRKGQPIKVCTPSGQRRFLMTLVCPGGGRPTWSRLGSVGTVDRPRKGVKFAFPSYFKKLKPGQHNSHVVDLYRVSCPGKAHRLYFDMYNCLDGPKPWGVPAGLSRPVSWLLPRGRPRGHRAPK